MSANPGHPETDDAIGVGVVQFAPTADVEENLATIRRLAGLAAARGASLVIAPEYSQWFAPKLGPHWRAAAEPLDGPFVEGLRGIASALGVTLVAGLAEDVGDPVKAGNTIVALAATGETLAVYRKLHLYDAFGDTESDWFVPGADLDPVTFEHAGLTVGLQTCYDLRFPEVSRRLVDAGTDLLAVPSEWVRGPLKEHHWRTLSIARALENTVYLAAADHAPPVGVGNSMVVDPMGVEQVTIGEQTDAAVGWVSPARIAAVREVNPALRLRRFGVTPR